MNERDQTVAADLLRGVDAIANFIGETQRRVYYLAERGLLPIGKEGRSWVASKAALRAHYAKLTGAAA